MTADMKTIRARYRVTTPMFASGADRATAELRETSFKGVLRFWWRACVRSHLDGDYARIRMEEEQVFGGPDTGQSRVRVRLHAAGPTSSLAAGELLTRRVRVGQGALYLGYGTMSGREARLDRGCALPPLDLTAVLRVRGLDADQRTLLLEAVRALGLFGGMGARSRRGWGSLSLLAVDGDAECEAPVSPAQLRATVNEATGHHGGGRPGYTALSSGSRFLVGDAGTDPMVVLDQLGQRYQAFRKSLTRKSSGMHPERVGFGLPINYGTKVVNPERHHRRASPLFFHIHDCGGRAVPVVSFLPAAFLPEPPRVAVRAGDRRPGAGVDLPEQPDALYAPVHAFLDHLSVPGGPFRSVGATTR